MSKKKYDEAELVAAYIEYKSSTKVAKRFECSIETVLRAVRINKEIIPRKFCEYCGAEFESRRGDTRFCSKLCRDLAHRKEKGIKCNLNIEPFLKVCRVCGKEYKTRREASVTCSPDCAIAYRRADEGKKKESVYVKIVPQKFGGRFEYVESSKGRVMLKCSKCGMIISRAQSTVRDKNIKCEYCEEAKQLREARQRMTCFFIALKDAKTPKRCAGCGKVFTSNRPTKKYCSDRCKRSGKTYRSRCRHYGVYYDPSVTRAKVIKRDKYICQICGKTCDPQDKSWGSSGANFPTLDHIIPLAKGGTHTWGNVQCACGACNSNKRDLISYAAEVS